MLVKLACSIRGHDLIAIAECDLHYDHIGVDLFSVVLDHDENMECIDALTTSEKEDLVLKLARHGEQVIKNAPKWGGCLV